MKGTYNIVVQSRRMQYKFTIRRNITVISGDSATGKTTLIELIQEYNNNGQDSGVSISCERECIVLSGRNWLRDLQQISGAIVFIDEGNRFMLTDEFARAIKNTDNYYVLITRECLPHIPYSVEEKYGIRTSGKFGSLQPAVHEMYNLYSNRAIDTNFQPACIITEDSNSGYDFFREICKEGKAACVSSGGKSNIFSNLLEKINDNVLIVADGAAFGPELDRILLLMKSHDNIVLYLPESFEWMILAAGLFDNQEIESVLAEPSSFIDSIEYFSWEQFFTKVLGKITEGTIWKYSKKALNPVYLHETNKRKIISIMGKIPGITAEG